MLRATRPARCPAVFTLADVTPGLFKREASAAAAAKRGGDAPSVVLQGRDRTAPLHRFQATWERGQLRGVIDYYGALTGGLGKCRFLPRLREAASAMVMHTPFLTQTALPCPHVVLLPRDDPLLALKLQKKSSSKDAAQGSEEDTSFAALQLKAALEGIRLADVEFGAKRRGGLITAIEANDPKFEFHIHRRFDGAGDALAYLRGLGHYLPMVFYGDTVFFGQDVVDAFASGRVTVDPRHGMTERHIRSIHSLWDMGFDLELPGLRPSQLRTLRNKHGKNEALLIGQRLKVEYRKVRANGTVDVDAVSLLAPDEEAASWQGASKDRDPESEAIDGLLRGATDFPQEVVSGGSHGTNPNLGGLLLTLPMVSESRLEARFARVLDRLDAWAAASVPGGKWRGGKLPETLDTIVRDAQRICTLDDVAAVLAASWAALEPTMAAASVRDAAADPAKTPRAAAKLVDVACAAYVHTVESTLSALLKAAREKARAQHRSLAENPATRIKHELPIDDSVPAHLPFYDNVLTATALSGN
jgi:hypothetical protein